MPNPFYQIYEGAALLAGARAATTSTRTAATGFRAGSGRGARSGLAALPGAVPVQSRQSDRRGAVRSHSCSSALELAERYDFIVAADECYTEHLSGRGRPAARAAAGRAGERAATRFQRCVVFHSLSKRSSVPGLRSGFVAGDPAIIERFLLYRTYHGSAMPVPTQLASIAAWDDDAHAAANRALYQEKFARVLPILVRRCWTSAVPTARSTCGPTWAATTSASRASCTDKQNVTVLPGSYLARAGAQGNPGAGRVRISLAPPVADCVEAAGRIGISCAAAGSRARLPRHER